MNLEFPRFVFTSPGPLVCNGGTYGEQIVNDETEYKAALDVGFCHSIPDALEAAKAERVAKASVTPNAPTQDEVFNALDKRAKELGIKVDSRWGEKRLAAEIAKAEEAQGGD